MIKLICSDIDNTLLKGRDPSEGRDVIGLLARSGILTALATGRSPADVFDLFPEAASQTAVIGYDGAVCLYKGQTVYARPVEKDLFRAFFDTLAPKAGREFDLIFYGERTCYIKGCGDALKRLEKDATMQGHSAVVENALEIPEHIYKISLYSEKNTDFDYVVNAWQDYLNPIYHKGNWCEFVLRGIDKGSALGILMERFGIRRNEAMAFGDGVNDFPMLAAVDYSYAIEGSPADRECAAEFVTSNVARTIKQVLGAQLLN
ncbi:MAG: HAD family phosphatase [Clostridia bacterium]|nr:HAD family phosphatase [Clostridia bacterium]